MKLTFWLALRSGRILVHDFLYKHVQISQVWATRRIGISVRCAVALCVDWATCIYEVLLHVRRSPFPFAGIGEELQRQCFG